MNRETQAVEQAEHKNNGATTEVGITVFTQHIRDISFENLTTAQDFGVEIESDIAVNLNLQTAKHGPGKHLLILNLEVQNRNKATHKKLFLLELSYVIGLEFFNLPEERHMAALVIEGGRLAFPSMRHIAREMIIEGGFAAFHLEPVDFAALYQRGSAAGANGTKSAEQPSKADV